MQSTVWGRERGILIRLELPPWNSHQDCCPSAPSPSSVSAKEWLKSSRWGPAAGRGVKSRRCFLSAVGEGGGEDTQSKLWRGGKAGKGRQQIKANLITPRQPLWVTEVFGDIVS